ncbi:MAG: DNA polymerase III subunit delta [Cellvibrionaceae bacterium]
MAKLRPEHVTKELNNKISPIYWISGDEPLVAQECADEIRAAGKNAGFIERELYHADNNFDWNLLHYAGQSLSLFGSQKIIELRLTGKLNDAGRKALVEYCASPPPSDILLLIISPKIERSTQNAKWFKAVESASQFIQVWPITGAQLPRWIDLRAKKMGLSIDATALDILTSRVEGNLLAASQEIEKLKLLTDDGKIDASLMAHAVANSARYDVFTLIDKALHGDARGAIANLSGLKSEGTEVMQILWALTREIRTLLELSNALANGKNFATAAKSFGIWDNRQSLIKNALSRLKQPQLQTLLRKAGQVDRAAKGMHSANAWDGCIDIVLTLAGVNAFNKQSERTALYHSR